MAWNEPDDNQDKPRRDGRPGQGPPDLDAVLSQLLQRIRKLFDQRSGGQGGGKDGGKGGLDWANGKLIAVGLAVVVVVWAMLGVYQVNEQERALILRFGKYHRIVTPGLHWLPPLVEAKGIVNVTQVYTWTHHATMLTEDANIVDVRISVQYRIDDPKNFLLSINDPLRTMQLSAESALRHVVGGTVMDSIITVGREEAAVAVKARLQEYLDRYRTGIMVSQVNIADAQAPQQVREAFDDVIKAKEDKERFVNEALGYSNGIIPEARGRALRVREEALGYKEQVIANAQGEAKRFLQQLNAYRQAPRVTRERLYLETMQEVFQRVSKIVVDVKGSNSLLYLPLDKLVSSRPEDSGPLGSGRGGQGGTVINESDLREIADQIARQINSRGNPR